MIRFVLQDSYRNKGNTKGRLICVLFRTANYARGSKWKKVLWTPYLVFYKFFVEWLMGIEIPFDVKVGRGLNVYHGQGLVVNRNVIVGENVTLRHNTTIGNAYANGRCPIIEDNVTVGANCIIIGDVVVGRNAIIGAGSVVVKNVPSGAIVAGNPARIIRMQEVVENEALVLI